MGRPMCKWDGSRNSRDPPAAALGTMSLRQGHHVGYNMSAIPALSDFDDAASYSHC